MLCELQHAARTFYIFVSLTLALGPDSRCSQKRQRFLTSLVRLLDHLRRYRGMHVGAVVEQEFQYVLGFFQSERQQQRGSGFSRLVRAETVFDQTTYYVCIGLG